MKVQRNVIIRIDLYSTATIHLYSYINIETKTKAHIFLIYFPKKIMRTIAEAKENI